MNIAQGYYECCFNSWYTWTILQVTLNTLSKLKTPIGILIENIFWKIKTYKIFFYKFIFINDWNLDTCSTFNPQLLREKQINFSFSGQPAIIRPNSTQQTRNKILDTYFRFQIIVFFVDRILILKTLSTWEHQVRKIINTIDFGVLKNVVGNLLVTSVPVHQL